MRKRHAGTDCSSRGLSTVPELASNAKTTAEDIHEFSTNPASFKWFYMSVLGELSHFGDVVRKERRKLLWAHGGWQKTDAQ